MRQVTISQQKLRKSFRVPAAEDWDRVAAYLVPHLKPGTVVALSGPLGAGKTTCVQALAQALGIKRRPQSPTFALMRTYRLPKKINGISRLIHVDAYRIETEADLMVLDLDSELGDGQSILVIEWPEKIPMWIAEHKHISLQII